MVGVKRFTYPDPIRLGYEVRDDGNVWITVENARACFRVSHDVESPAPEDAYIQLRQGGESQLIAQIEFEGQGWLDWGYNEEPEPEGVWPECGEPEDFSDTVVGRIEGRAWSPQGITPGSAAIVAESQDFGSEVIFQEAVQVIGDLPTKDKIRATDVSVSESDFTVSGSFALDNPVPFGYDVTVRITADDERSGQRILTRKRTINKAGSVEAGRGNVERYDIEPFDVPPGAELRVCAEVINVA